MVKTPCFKCRGHRFDPWLGNEDSTCYTVQSGKKKKELEVRAELRHVEKRKVLSALQRTQKSPRNPTVTLNAFT